jgi:alpha/beta superfamily hydrolase
VCFSHGKESGPWGTKIKALAEIARTAGWQVESLDYQGMDDPQARVALLAAWCANTDSAYVLVGSSMGGHVAAAVAAGQPPLGLFLMAPAFFMPGYEQYTPTYPECPVTIVHGWHDDIVPWQNSVRFAESGSANVVLLDSDHRLTDVLDEVGQQFTLFLATFAASKRESNDV